MDAFGTIDGGMGVISLALKLLGGCIKGFHLLSSAQNLGKNAFTIVCMLDMQEAHLIEWARRTGLLNDDGVMNPRLNQKAVEEALGKLQNLLLDTEALEKRYGLKLIPLSEVQERTTMNIRDTSASDIERVFLGVSDETRRRILARAEIVQDTNRLWWSTVDKKKIGELVLHVRYLINDLWQLYEPWRHDDPVETLASHAVRWNNRFDQLNSLMEALREAFQKDIRLQKVASSAETKALQISLRNDPGELAVPRATLPPRQNLLNRLERLSRSKVSGYTPMKGRGIMGIALYEGRTVFAEVKFVDSVSLSKIIPRAENLAVLLNLPKHETFRSLRCRGILEDQNEMGTYVMFIFEHPTPDRPKGIRSLLDLFSSKDGLEPPSLTDRIKLALSITELVRSFHGVGWLHKSLRSENILFFPGKDETSARSILADPLLGGFTFARLGNPTEISEQPSKDPLRDVYRHPKAMGEPTETFDEAKDVYSLGTILLEIIEWRPLKFLVEEVVKVDGEEVLMTDLAKIRSFLLGGKGKRGSSKLHNRAGDIYAQVCLTCLRGEVQPADLEGDDSSGMQSSLLEVALKRLKSCKV